MFTDNITLGFPYSTREVNFKLLVSGVDRLVAAIISQDLGVQHFDDENGHMLCFM